jgi:uncharacterized membrane protein
MSKMRYSDNRTVGFQGNVDLLLVVVMSLLMLPLAVFGDGVVRVGVGLIYVLFCPGYALVSALFPAKKGLGALERVALSIGMSIVLTPLMGLVANLSPFGIRIFTMLPAFSLFILAAAAVAWLRRQSLPAEESLGVERISGHLLQPGFWKMQGWLNTVLSALLVAVVVATMGFLIYLVTSARIDGKGTDFYLLGPQGKAENYPENVGLGQKASVVVGIMNRDGSQNTYRVEIALDGEAVAEYPSIVLPAGKQVERMVDFAPAKTGQQMVEVRLYHEPEAKPKKSLRFWIEVASGS